MQFAFNFAIILANSWHIFCEIFYVNHYCQANRSYLTSDITTDNLNLIYFSFFLWLEIFFLQLGIVKIRKVFSYVFYIINKVMFYWILSL